MSDLIDAFRVQFDARITKIKEDLCRDVDVQANGLFGLFEEEWRKRMQSTGDQVVVKNEENNGNAGDDHVSGHVKVEDESIKCECDSENELDTDSDTDEDNDVMIEEQEDDDDNGELDADVNDDESMDDGEGNDSTGTNQAMSDEEDTVNNAVDDNESAVNQEDVSGDEHEDDDEHADNAVAGSDNQLNGALNNSSAFVANEPILQVASTSGLRRSNRTSVKRQQIIPDDVTSSDEEDSGSEDNQAGPKRKRARVEAAPAARDRPRQEATVDQEDSKHVITIRLNCTVTGCAQNCRDKGQLIEHLKRKHRIDRFPCHVQGCTASFTTQHKLTEHLRSAHGSLTRWPCGHCAVQCASYHGLSTHVWLYHELGRFVCGHAGCDFPASTHRMKVINHQLQHKTATLQCTFTGCGMAFKKSSHLKMHLLTHTGERPFVCDYCQQAFNQKPNLTRHVCTQHTHIGVKSFVCDQCQKAFTLKQHLTQHVSRKH